MPRPVRVALIPGVLALLPEYAGIEDPVPDVRAACLRAVTWLGQAGPFAAHGPTHSGRLAQHLGVVCEVPLDLSAAQPPAILLVANGSARRSERAPGHLDDRAHDFDAELRDMLTAHPERLGSLDHALARDLWADTEALRWLDQHIALNPETARMDYDDDALGVQYWVMRWQGHWRERAT